MSGDGRGLQNRLRDCESKLGWVRLPHVSAISILDFGFGIADLRKGTWIMNQNEMKERTKKFALRVIRLVESLPNTKTSNVLGNQLLRSGTSVGANYRAACRAKSTADFISKLSVVEEEADESIFWIELLVESDQIKHKLGVRGQWRDDRVIDHLTYIDSLSTAKP